MDKVLLEPCPKCRGSNVSIAASEDYVEGLFQRAASSGAGIRLISTESEEGEMLAKAFGGVAALLRYPLARRTAGPRASSAAVL